MIFIGGCQNNVSDLKLTANHIKSVTIYDLDGIRKSDYSPQEIDNATKANVDPKLFASFIMDARYEKNSWEPWMGSSLAIITMNDGSSKKLALSYWGTFFEEIGSKGIFYFDGQERTKWQQIYTQDIVRSKFIPKRVESRKQQQ